MSLKGMVSIWFIVGCLLAAYGVLILFAGIQDYSSPETGFVLSNLHLQLWWGAALLLLGCFYLVRFRPGRRE